MYGQLKASWSLHTEFSVLVFTTSQGSDMLFCDYNMYLVDRLVNPDGMTPEITQGFEYQNKCIQQSMSWDYVSETSWEKLKKELQS